MQSATDHEPQTACVRWQDKEAFAITAQARSSASNWLETISATALAKWKWLISCWFWIFDNACYCHVTSEISDYGLQSPHLSLVCTSVTLLATSVLTCGCLHCVNTSFLFFLLLEFPLFCLIDIHCVRKKSNPLNNVR